MKKVLIFLTLVLMGTYGFSQQTATPAPVPELKPEVAVLEWDSQSHDFGKIKQGMPVTHEFKFTNKGKVPLIITNVAASCGCTTPSWTTEPVPAGQKGFVKATYNAGAMGVFDKSVTVTANTEQGFVQLKIKGEVTAQAVQK